MKVLTGDGADDDAERTGGGRHVDRRRGNAVQENLPRLDRHGAVHEVHLLHLRLTRPR